MVANSHQNSTTDLDVVRPSKPTTNRSAQAIQELRELLKDFCPNHKGKVKKDSFTM